MSPATGSIDSQPPYLSPTAGAINSDRQADVQRRKRSTPTRRTGVQREKGLSLQPPDEAGDEGLDQLRPSARAACEGLVTPHWQHSLVGDRGRANHPPIIPVQQGSRTQVSMVGNLGQKPNSAVIVAVPGAAKEGLQDPPGRLPPNRSIKFTTNPPPGYRHNRPKVKRRRSSRFRRALRVS